MAKFTVTDKWISADGEHKIGDTVEIPYETPREKVEADKLITWGVIEKASEKTEEKKADKSASK
jgi:hypothetical protein